ncbi:MULTISPECIES: hypothetical protein [Bizionia]|uniref:Uncharacterized protein n=1 Tax=Bizionia algoritergicola TaxID=291187 RepID=A0A5D0R0U4_9FLAO|nr:MULTISPECIES: hypothetical protein [Bizionia]OBX20955.1 hypothetical protein BAA08_14545 [Bizionia sp. APA-3]TYB74595.1 hypothetical protein ES675_00175 [Bizionia algoritergicola]
MALNKAALKTSIIGIMEDMMTRENTSIEEFATRLSDAVDVYVKAADIIYTAGLIDAEARPVIGTFEGNLQ